MKNRLLGKFSAYSRSDEFDLQIRFEGWVDHFPHIKEIYDQNRLIIKLDEDNNFLIETQMSDEQWVIWCIKYPETPIKDWPNA
jgi:hypothetical protein